jgi:PLD-like domain
MRDCVVPGHDRRALLQAFRTLACEAEVGAPICLALGRRDITTALDEPGYCTAAGIPLARKADVHRFLQTCAAMGLFTTSDLSRWRPLREPEYFVALGMMLEAVSVYLMDIHHDADLVDVVLTRPPRPSRLETALEATNYSAVTIENTTEMFIDIAATARERFVVMTPFLDEAGARWLLTLIERTKPEAQKVVVLRFIDEPDKYAPGYPLIARELKDAAVEVFDFALPREGMPGSYETFHAKVVLADRDYCYVGSSNINRASLSHSMELGLAVKGQAAARVARVVECILQIAKKCY